MGPAAVKRDLTDKMRDAQKKEARTQTKMLGPDSSPALRNRPRLARSALSRSAQTPLAQVEESLEGIESGRMVPTRFLRKEAARQKELLAAAAAASQGADAPAAASTSAPAVRGRRDTLRTLLPAAVPPAQASAAELFSLNPPRRSLGLLTLTSSAILRTSSRDSPRRTGAGLSRARACPAPVRHLSSRAETPRKADLARHSRAPCHLFYRREKPAFWDGAVSSAWKERHAAFNDLKEWCGPDSSLQSTLSGIGPLALSFARGLIVSHAPVSSRLARRASTPRIAPGDFGEVARIIRKTLLKDSNVAVITEAVMAAANLAKGLRKDFRGDAKMLVPALLDKLKDKTTNLVRQITVTLSALNSHCLSIADMSDDLIAAFAHRVPKVQTESLEWTAGAVAALDKPSAAKLHKEFVPEARRLPRSPPRGSALPALSQPHIWTTSATPLRQANALFPPPFLSQMLKLSEAADPAVRNAALSVLAAFCKAGGGYGAIGAHFPLLDDVCVLSANLFCIFLPQCDLALKASPANPGRLVDEKLDAAKKKKLEELIGSASGAAPATAASAAQPPSSAAAPAPLVESAALKARDTNAPPPRAAASIKAAPKLAASSKSLGGAAKARAAPRRAARDATACKRYFQRSACFCASLREVSNLTLPAHLQAAKKDAAPADEPVDVGTRSPEEVAEACRALFGAEVVNNLGLADWCARVGLRATSHRASRPLQKSFSFCFT